MRSEDTREHHRRPDEIRGDHRLDRRRTVENRDKRRSNELRLERRRPEKATGDQSRLEDAKEL